MVRDLEAQIDDALSSALKPGKSAAMVVPDLADVWQRYAKVVKPIQGIREHHSRLQRLDYALPDPLAQIEHAYAEFKATFTDPNSSLARIVNGMRVLASDMVGMEWSCTTLADGPWTGPRLEGWKQFGKRYRPSLLAVAGHLRLLINEVNRNIHRLEQLAFNATNLS